MPLFFLSGALFPLDSAPQTLRIIGTFDPLSYGVDALRGTLTGVSHFGLGMDFAVLAALTFLAVWLGSYLFSKIEA